MGHLKDHFIPHDDNDHKPHFLREAGVAVLVLVVVAVFALTAVQTRFISQHEGFLASVLPSVLIDLANEDRQEADLPPLRVSEELQRAAQMKADHMAEHGYFSHYAPSGETPWTWFRRAGYSYLYAGENLAVNFADSRDVERAWMDSTMHRENILDNQFTEVGIATAKGEYKGQETVFVVQMFGTPARAATAGDSDGSSDTAAQAQTSGAVAGATQPAETSSSAVTTGKDAPDKLAQVEEEDDTAVGHSETTVTPTGTESEGDITAVTTTPQAVGSIDTANGGGTPSYASPLEHLLAQPGKVMQIMYLTLAVLIALALVAMVGVEIQKQHPKHAFYGASLLVLILLFSYVGQVLLFPNPVVI